MRTRKIFLMLALLTTITLLTTSIASAAFWDWLTGNNQEEENIVAVPQGGEGNSADSASATPSVAQGGQPVDLPDTSDLEGPGVITDWILLKAPDGRYWVVDVDNRGNLITYPFVEGE